MFNLFWSTLEMMNYSVLTFYFISMSVWKMAFSKNKLFILLLTLEFISLNLFILMVVASINFYFPIIFFIVFFTFNVCEACIGLTLLIKISRNKGNDYLSV